MGTSLIPGQGTKITYAVQCSKKKKKETVILFYVLQAALWSKPNSMARSNQYPAPAEPYDEGGSPLDW